MVLTLIGLGFMFMAGHKLASKEPWSWAYFLISIAIIFWGR